MRLPSVLLAILTLSLSAACGDDATPTVDAPPGVGPDAPPGGGPDAAMGTRFITSAYTIAAGSEKYQCERLTVATDTYIQQITPVNDTGTHHETFNIDPSPAADGTSACGPLENEWQPLFASGVGSGTIAMPAGVALKIPAGSQVVLNLHLFNTDDAEVSGEAGLDVVLIDAASVQQEAEVVLAGVVPQTPPSPPIATGVQTRTGTCRMTGATNIVAIFPHMHQLGTHLKMDTVIGGTTTTAYDQDYSFTDQRFHIFPTPIAMGSNDALNVTCTYNNTTGGSVNFGDSSNEEMCFAIAWRYPKLGTSFGGICSF